MFTLNFPIALPKTHTYFDNGQHQIPKLPNELSLTFIDLGDSPLVLKIMGFSSENDALTYCPTLKDAIRVASLNLDHSIALLTGTPAVSGAKIFDGSVPTVTQTSTAAEPIFATGTMKREDHISVLSRHIGNAIASGAVARLRADPRLSLSLELYADSQFAGGNNAVFIVLMTALEVLVPKEIKKGKRGAVIAIVKNALSKSSHSSSKLGGKDLDNLYKTRNRLLHEGETIAIVQLNLLRAIVQSTLKALISYD